MGQNIAYAVPHAWIPTLFPSEGTLPPTRESMPKAIRKSKTEVKRQRVTGQPLTPRQKRELAALAAMPDDQIDTSDIPELPPNAWKDAIRGRFYRPLKQAVSMRLDADVVAWLKKRGKGYQTRANNILRQRMLRRKQARLSSESKVRNQIRKLSLALPPIHLL